jgi:crotonobetainyl-CoA:carnitine CoA-transferase CaiB-like acyl-CoA transferase
MQGIRPVLPEPERRPTGAPHALAGIRILDFTRMLAGPVGTMLLADLGADVIKVENPETGDDARGLKPPQLGGESAVFLWGNRNKRSIALDLRLPEGQQIARDLAKQADVVVENFSGGVMDRFGLSYADLSKDNPRLIFCAISAFGRGGRFATRPGYDPIVQAESGFLSLNGLPDHEPVRAGASIMDISCGMMVCNTVLAALLARAHHGIGQYTEVSLFDDAIMMTGQYGMNYLMTGEDQMRFGNGSKTAEPVGLFDAADGPIYVTCANNRNFERLAVSVLALPELATDARFTTNALRVRHSAELRACIAGYFREQPRKHWVDKGNETGVPIGYVRSIAEAFNSDEVKEQKLLSQLPHPTASTIPNIAPPFRFFGTPLADPVAAPLLGAHTDQVLADLLGYDADRLAGLAQAGVFGSARRA